MIQSLDIALAADNIDSRRDLLLKTYNYNRIGRPENGLKVSLEDIVSIHTNDLHGRDNHHEGKQRDSVSASKNENL